MVLTCPLCTFSMESLPWTSLLLVIFATSISVEAGIQPFKEAFLTYGKKVVVHLSHMSKPRCNLSQSRTVRSYAWHYCCMPLSPALLHIYSPCFSDFWHCHSNILMTTLVHWIFFVCSYKFFIYIACCKSIVDAGTIVYTTWVNHMTNRHSIRKWCMQSMGKWHPTIRKYS